MEPRPCGTVSAYARHHRLGEPPCEPCRVARNAYDAERKLRKRRGEDMRRAPAHGTMAGWRAHQAASEAVCAPCGEAWTSWRAKRNAQERTRQRTGKRPERPPCGTVGGFMSHMSRGEPACGPCQLAESQRRRRYGAELPRMRTGGVETVTVRGVTVKTNLTVADMLRRPQDPGRGPVFFADDDALDRWLLRVGTPAS